MPQEPGPFGWVSKLTRWAQADRSASGATGPLPPPKARAVDPAEHELYQGMIDGWMHGTVGAALSSFFSEPRTRKELYVLYEKMDMTDMAGSVLDLYAEDATQQDAETGRTVWFEGPDEIVDECNELAERLKLEEESTALVRDIAKNGDDFERLVYRSGPEGGVMRMVPVVPLSIMRKEDKNGKLQGYQQTGKRFKNDNSETSYPWDFVHFRLRGKDRRYPYGTSVLHNGIRPWKSIIVLEDWMIGYQIAKHPDRNLFMLDVGTSSDVEAAQVTHQFRQKLRKHMLVDPGGVSGKNAGFNYAPTSPLDDIVLPIRKDSSTSVTKLSGSGNATEIGPLELQTNKFFSAVKAPKNFFGFDSSQPTNPKASLTNQDVRYARGVKRLQRAYKQGIRYLAELNLILKMAPGDRVESDLKNVDLSYLDWRLPDRDFKIHMSPISFLDELERLEVMQTRMQVALILMELSANNPVFDVMNWTRYILREVVKVPEAKLDELLRQDLDQAAIDNITAGMLPDGSMPGAPAGGAGQTAEARSRRIPAHVLREAAKADGELTLDEKKLLSEAINTRPELRRLIHLSRATFKDLDEGDDLVRVSPYMLPDRDNELFQKGLLTDVLTEADLAEIAAEVMAG